MLRTAILCSMFTFACSSNLAENDSTLTLEEFEENSDAMEKPPPDPAANPNELAADECIVECLSSDDCCEGYYCGKDPQRSRRRDYCLPGG